LTNPLLVGHLLHTSKKSSSVRLLLLHLQRHPLALRTGSLSLRLRLPNALLPGKLLTETPDGIVDTAVVEVAQWRAREIAVVVSLVD
jgi:hypothetical protein